MDSDSAASRRNQVRNGECEVCTHRKQQKDIKNNIYNMQIN